MKLIFYSQILSTLLSSWSLTFICVNLPHRKQTNSPELSGPSEAQITYHLLHCAKLIMSRVACNGCSEYTTLISTVQRRASLNHNEKIKFNLFGELFVWAWFLANIYMLEVCREMQ